MPIAQPGHGANVTVMGDYIDWGTQHNQSSPPVVTLHPFKYVYVPPRPLSPRFTGQEKYLKKLRKYFGPQISQTPRRRSFLLHGKGGAGKTQLGLKFAEENAKRFWIFWVDASTVESMEQSVKAIADDAVAQAARVERSTRAVLQWLSRTDHEWFLIFDNADGDPNIISQFVPPGDRGNILFTSRNPMVGNHVPSSKARVEVDAMNEDDAIALLLKSAMLEEPYEDSDHASAKAIVKELCFFPLAVDQAGAAIASGLCSIRDYLARYSTRRCELLKFPSFEGASQSGRAVYTTWDLSYMAIQAVASGVSSPESQAAASAIFILETFAFFHHNHISEDIIKRAAEAPNFARNPKINRLSFFRKLISKIFRKKHLQLDRQDSLHGLAPHYLIYLDGSGKWDPLPFRNGFRILNSYSLIKRNIRDGRNSYSIHPLVHSWSRDRMSQYNRENACRTARAFLVSSITWNFHAADYAFRRDLIPHIKYMSTVAMGRIETYQEKECINLGLAYYENGFLDDAEKLLASVMKHRKSGLGEHPDTLKSMTILVSTLSAQGRHKEAKELEDLLAKSRKKTLGGAGVIYESSDPTDTETWNGWSAPSSDPEPSTSYSRIYQPLSLPSTEEITIEPMPSNSRLLA